MINRFFKLFAVLFLSLGSVTSYGQYGYWQQFINYRIDVEVDTKNYLLHGKETISYNNNSPDTLKKVFFHLYYNAFQPNSMMDVRSRSISDPSWKIKDRIVKLSPKEIGYQKIKSLTSNGKNLPYKVEGTIMEVALDKWILPGKNARFEIEFEAQIPVQIRRTGRNNKEGIALSMTQWYPKMAEYDYEGWHTDPYIAREFHGVWGNFDVNITIDKNFIIGGSGILTNPQEIGFGYEDKSKSLTILPIDGKLTWKFKAENIHDFAWAADTNFVVDKIKTKNDVNIYFVHQKDPLVVDTWKKMMPYAKKGFEIMGEKIGKYPYTQYTIVQGGDGGMEYGMATLINGRRGIKNFERFCSLVFHESFHSWFQHILATNESKYAWMDEGFTSYAEEMIFHEIFNKSGRLQDPAYKSYRKFAKSKMEEPLSTHADHFQTNRAYGIGSYVKGAIFLYQLGYIIGEKNLAKSLRRYFSEWKFKHPTSNDFIRISEKVSGIELNWYLDYWINTTHTIDYGIKNISQQKNGNTNILLERKGIMPMPQDIRVTFIDGSVMNYYIPMVIMRGEKSNETGGKREVLPNWSWTHQTYNFEIPYPLKKIRTVSLDPTQRMADINLDNNLIEF